MVGGPGAGLAQGAMRHGNNLRDVAAVSSEVGQRAQDAGADAELSKLLPDVEVGEGLLARGRGWEHVVGAIHAVQSRSLGRRLVGMVFSIVVAVLSRAGEGLQFHVTHLGPHCRAEQERGHLPTLGGGHQRQRHRLCPDLHLSPIHCPCDGGRTSGGGGIVVARSIHWVLSSAEEGEGSVGVATEHGAQATWGRVNNCIAFWRVPLEYSVGH